MPQNKFQASPLGIDPGSYRLVAQCLNCYATPGPLFLCRRRKFDALCKALLPKNSVSISRSNIITNTGTGNLVQCSAGWLQEKGLSVFASAMTLVTELMSVLETLVAH